MNVGLKMVSRSLKMLAVLALLSQDFLPTDLALAYVASSTNYRIERDSINFAGIRSTSSNFGLEDTLGETGTGLGTSTSYTLYAGYQQPEPSISISSPADVALVPVISVSGGVANGTANWTVATDSPGGYTLAIKAATSPAMQSSSASFANYAPSGSVPDFNWSVSSGSAEFGFTPEGSDIASAYKDDGSICSSGSGDASASCWDGISTSNKTISRRTSSNHPSGTITTVRFRAEIGVSASQPAGSYSAVITVTAVAL